MKIIDSAPLGFNGLFSNTTSTFYAQCLFIQKVSLLFFLFFKNGYLYFVYCIFNVKNVNDNNK
jgi:hypothetical protein